MSDHEPQPIDDVLSAIRRLVDGKGDAGKAQALPAPRLLLTPALRVEDSLPKAPVAPLIASMDHALKTNPDEDWEPAEGDPAPSGAWDTYVEPEPSYFFGRAPAFGAAEDSPEAPFVAIEDEQAALDPQAPIDEAALRAIVKQVLREELQGDLGERITRNVRKLVRREIYRAMAAQELD